MGGGDHQIMVVVLVLGESILQLVLMMIEDERQYTDDFALSGPLLPNELVPDHIADGLGAIPVLPTLDVGVKLGEKILIERC